MSKYNTSVSLNSTVSIVNWNLGRIIMLNLAKFGVGVIAFIVGLSLMTTATTGFFGLIAAGSMEGLSEFNIEDLGEMFAELSDLGGIIASDVGFWEIVSGLLVLFLGVYFLLFIPIGLCSIVGSILTPGYHNGLISLAQSENVKASVLLSRLRHFLASIGLPLWRSLKTWAWAIPGLAIMLLGNTITVATVVEDSEYLVLSLPKGLIGAIMPYGLVGYEEFYFGDFVWFCGLATVLALVIPAWLRYSMAAYVYAETPKIGVYDAIEYSKAVMNFRCGTLFMVILPYLLINIGILVAYYFLNKWLADVDFGMFTVFVYEILRYGALLGIIYVGFLRDMAYVNFYLENKA